MKMVYIIPHSCGIGIKRPLFRQPLADGGIEVDGERRVAGSGPSGPGPGQQLPAHPVQLADVAPTEAAQEGAQGGWRVID